MVYEQKIECAERAAEMLGSLEPIDSIFAGGSLTAGLGNITSDVDLFLLVKDKAQFEETWQSIDRGNRIDVEVYTLDELGQALRESCETKFAPARSGIVRDLERSLDLVSRFAYARVLKQSNALFELQNYLKERFNNFLSVMVNYWALDVEAAKEDFIGAAYEQDYGSAVFSGQAMVAAAGKQMAASWGKCYFSKKWVYKQLVQLGLKERALDYYVEMQRGSWRSLGAEGAVALLNYTQALQALSHLKLNGINIGNDGLLWCKAGEPGAGRYYRHPGYGVFSIDEKALLHWELHKDVTLSMRMLTLWTICQGKNDEEILAEILETPVVTELFGEMSLDRLHGMLQTLEKAGLVSKQAFVLRDIVC